MRTRRLVRAVAAFEATKGLLALGAAVVLLLLLHNDLHGLAVRLVEYAHLDPTAHYPGIFIGAAEQLQNTSYALVALGAIAYSTLRFVEAFGLYLETAWAEVLAAASGVVYVPFEVVELVHRTSWFSLGALVINLAVVAILVLALSRRKNLQALASAPAR